MEGGTGKDPSRVRTTARARTAHVDRDARPRYESRPGSYQNRSARPRTTGQTAKAHKEANAARELTNDQRRDRKVLKMKEDSSRESRSRCIGFATCTTSRPKSRTGRRRGRAKATEEIQAPPTASHRVGRDLAKNADGNEVSNSCVMVLEGTAQWRHFGEVMYKSLPMEESAREIFQKHHVKHYWDLAYSDCGAGSGRFAIRWNPR